MARKYKYNIVMRSNDCCKEGMLFTDRELYKFQRDTHPRDWPETAPVEVPAGTTYFSFGARFTTLQDQFLPRHITNN